MLGEAVAWIVKVQKTVRRGSTLRVSIPAEIVKSLGLKPGDRLVARVMDIDVDGRRVKAIVYYKPSF